MAKFYSVGVGAGDGSYITLGALRALEQADIIAVPVKKYEEKSTALEKLKMYVEAYLQSQQQIQLIPTENIAKFIEKDESAVNFDNVLTNIESLAKDDNYGYRKADPYWARVLGQTEQFKSQDGLLQLVKQTTSWFGEMLT